METGTDLARHISQSPDVLRGGVYWLGFISLVSVLFALTRIEARWILAASLAGLGLTMLLYAQVGYTSVLVFGHMLTAIPLLFWLVWRNPVSGFREPYDLYLVLFFTSTLIALGLGVAGLYSHATGATSIL